MGDGHRCESLQEAIITVGIHGALGEIVASVIPGKSPPLISRQAQTQLGINVYMRSCEYDIPDLGVTRRPFLLTRTGSLLLRLSDFPPISSRRARDQGAPMRIRGRDVRVRRALSAQLTCVSAVPVVHSEAYAVGASGHVSAPGSLSAGGIVPVPEARSGRRAQDRRSGVGPRRRRGLDVPGSDADCGDGVTGGLSTTAHATSIGRT